MRRITRAAARRHARRLARARSRRPAEQAPTHISPLAPRGGFPPLPVVRGATFATASAGIRYAGRDDVMLALLAPGTAVAGATTRSATRAAPVLDAEDKLARPRSTDAAAAILVNAGNANAFTGSNGRAAVAALVQAVAAATGVPGERVFSASTGVIGEPLQWQRISAILGHLVDGLSETALPAAARAIMTTDTFPKGAGTTVTLGTEPVAIAGIAKGSGMIAPDMATMLVHIFTDARIDADHLQALVTDRIDRTFNCITVDSDTSTSDTLLVAATGRSGPAIARGSLEAARFGDALEAVMRDLAHQVVRDGEGATKFIGVRVTGAADAADARRCAMAIANSPLVKTAAAGEDPNWGRIVMAVGKSGARADRDRLAIWLGPHQVAENGWVAPDYREEIGATYMRRTELEIRVDLGIGSGHATVWTCDLTHRYIEINADYRS